jgi:hypothetical protein
MRSGAPLLVAHIGSSYAKKILRKRVAETGALDGIKNLSGESQQAWEAFLYVISAVIDRHLGDDTVVRKFLNEVITDTSTELGGAIGNNAQPSSSLHSLVGLSKSQFKEFLDWFEKADEQERKNIRMAARKSTTEGLRRLLSLSPRERQVALTFLTGQAAPRAVPLKGFLASLTERMRRPLFL